MEIKLSNLNPKKLVYDYYDALINKIDIHTEQQLEKFSSTDIFEFKPPENSEQQRCHIQESERYGIKSYKNPYHCADYKRSDFEISKRTRLNYGLIRTWDVLNATREEMIEKLRDCQTETLGKLEQVKHDVAKINAEEIANEEKVEKIFSLKFAEKFPIILDVKNSWRICETRRLPFNLILIELDFFIRKSQITCL